jgi:hypothetical protein
MSLSEPKMERSKNSTSLRSVAVLVGQASCRASRWEVVSVGRAPLALEMMMGICRFLCIWRHGLPRSSLPSSDGDLSRDDLSQSQRAEMVGHSARVAPVHDEVGREGNA